MQGKWEVLIDNISYDNNSNNRKHTPSDDNTDKKLKCAWIVVDRDIAVSVVEQVVLRMICLDQGKIVPKIVAYAMVLENVASAAVSDENKKYLHNLAADKS